ncbi:MAG: hypothetical protein LBM41_07900 [Ruminococcus sp.]|nr:hypothetical protein [Ruminococcus sp.]
MTKSIKNRGYISLILLSAVFVVGIAVGVILTAQYTDIDDKPVYFDYYRYFHSKDFLTNLIDRFSLTFFSLLLIFFLGFGSISTPFLPISLLFYGYKTGASLILIYMTYPADEIFGVLITEIPFAVLSGLILITACRESMRMSVSIWRVTIAASSIYTPVDYKLFINKFIILTAALLAVSAINTTFSYIII